MKPLFGVLLFSVILFCSAKGFAADATDDITQANNPLASMIII